MDIDKLKLNVTQWKCTDMPADTSYERINYDKEELTLDADTQMNK